MERDTFMTADDAKAFGLIDQRLRNAPCRKQRVNRTVVKVKRLISCLAQFLFVTDPDALYTVFVSHYRLLQKAK